MVPSYLLSGIPGVTVLSQRDAGGVEFSIERGAGERAVPALIRLLRDGGGELWFRDWEQDDGESMVLACNTPSGLEMMQGGHGYSSKWAPVDEEQLTKTFLRLVRYSQAAHYRVHGGFTGGGLIGGSGFEAHR